MVKKNLVLPGAQYPASVAVVVRECDYRTFELHAEAFAEYAYYNLAGGFMDELIKAYLRKSPYVRQRTLKVLAEYMGPA